MALVRPLGYRHRVKSYRGAIRRHIILASGSLAVLCGCGGRPCAPAHIVAYVYAGHPRIVGTRGNIILGQRISLRSLVVQHPCVHPIIYKTYPHSPGRSAALNGIAPNARCSLATLSIKQLSARTIIDGYPHRAIRQREKLDIVISVVHAVQPEVVPNLTGANIYSGHIGAGTLRVAAHDSPKSHH